MCIDAFHSYCHCAITNDIMTVFVHPIICCHRVTSLFVRSWWSDCWCMTQHALLSWPDIATHLYGFHTFTPETLCLTTLLGLPDLFADEHHLPHSVLDCHHLSLNTCMMWHSNHCFCLRDFYLMLHLHPNWYYDCMICNDITLSIARLSLLSPWCRVQPLAYCLLGVGRAMIRVLSYLAP